MARTTSRAPKGKLGVAPVPKEGVTLRREKPVLDPEPSVCGHCFNPAPEGVPYCSMSCRECASERGYQCDRCATMGKLMSGP